MGVKRIRDRSVELRKGVSRRSRSAAGAEAARRPTLVQAIPASASKPPTPTAVPSTVGNIPLPDFQKLSVNLARATEEGQKALAAYVKPIEQGETHGEVAAQVADCVNTLGQVAEHWLNDPKRTVDAQTKLTSGFIDLWGRTLKRMSGEAAEPLVPPDPSDRRFADPRWQELPFFDFLRQAYKLSSDWAEEMVAGADNLDPRTRAKATFYVRQITSALSPSNFIGTNPELLCDNARDERRESRARHEDAGRGYRGRQRRRCTSARAIRHKFQLGVNMAATPGKVIFRNELMELIQYAPTTEEVYKRPLLIVPPWINKFYVLDLNPEKCFIRWAVAQGLTVFVISWVNPDERHADKDFEHYMREGILAALDAIETGDRRARGRRRSAIASAARCLPSRSPIWPRTATTASTARPSSPHRSTSPTPAICKVFVDAEQIEAVEEKMADTGYLEGSKMANAFNMLRPNDLIWSYFVNNYLKGKEPMPFDLLVWNSDSTRMPRGQPQLLSAQLLSREQSRPRARWSSAA